MYKVLKATVKPSLRDHKLVFKIDYCLMYVKGVAECLKRAMCNYFDLHKLPFVFKTSALSILSGG